VYQYTDENFIQFGYNSEPFVYRTSSSDKFFVKYGKARRKVKSFKEELITTARLIKEKSEGLPLWVLYSGGLDSEVVLRSFSEAGVSVNAAIAWFKKGLNEHDIRYAVDFCESSQIPFKFFDIDVESFWKKQLKDYALPISCISPQFPVILWLIDQIDGFPILGSGDSFLSRIPNTNNFYFYEREKYFSYYFHLMRKNRPGVPAFVQYTPELMLSFLIDPELVRHVKYLSKEKKLCSISRWKYQVYKQHFSLKNRPDFTGFELLDYSEAYYRNLLKTKCKGGDQDIVIPYESLVKTLQADDMNFCSDSV